MEGSQAIPGEPPTPAVWTAPLPSPQRPDFRPGTGPFIVGFLKVYNELLKGNLHRVLENLSAVCDVIAVCDDGSVDGSYEVLSKHPKIPKNLLIRHDAPDFDSEIARKQELFERVSALKPQWILWLDGDEVLDAAGVADLREYLHSMRANTIRSFAFHEVNLWMGTGWARTDDALDDGWFWRVWRWGPDLAFNVRGGLHHDQFPAPLRTLPNERAPFNILHYGNAGRGPLRTKAVQYRKHDAAIARHLIYQSAQFRPVPASWFPDGAERYDNEQPDTHLDEATVERIKILGGLQNEPGLFTVVVPAFNREKTIGAALDSVLRQSYGKWVCVVLDDGSTDGTVEEALRYAREDPRIYVARYPKNRGGVAVNEIGMSIACQFGEFWSRLGSDDAWYPEKLQNDFNAFAVNPEWDAIFGPYHVMRKGERDPGVCNDKMSPVDIKAKLLGGGFCASWANVAARTSALRRVRTTFGGFVDKRLVNMEDFDFNIRLAKVGTWGWRAGIDGYWNVNTTQGASYNDGILAKDNATMQSILAGK